MFLWRNHGQGNPGLESIWWHSRHASGLALNFGRIVNPDLDALLRSYHRHEDPTKLPVREQLPGFRSTVQQALLTVG